jgi:hypothetical protein
MCVEFRSDCLTTDTGWEATWRALMPTTPVSDTEWLVGIYPNPVIDRFTVRTDDSGFTDLAVYDLLGNRMTPTLRFICTTEIDASQWPSGVYVVRYGLPLQMSKVVKLVKL